MARSPFFNKSETVTACMQYLADRHPKFRDEEVEKPAVFGYLFPHESYDDQRLRYIMSDLTKLVEQYLLWRQLEKEPVVSIHLQIRALQERSLTNLIPPYLEQAQRFNQKYPYVDQDRFFNAFLWERDNYEYVASKRNVAIRETLQNIITNLDYYYFINKLKFSAELANHVNVIAGQFDPLLLNEIVSVVENNQLHREPAVGIYYLILKMLLEPDQESYYQSLKETLSRSHELFPPGELNDMYIFARNYCARQINSGNTRYLREIFDLFNTLDASGILYHHGELSQWDYKNMVAVALRLEEYRWADDFIESAKQHIRVEDRENAYHYNKALYYYHLKHFDKTLELLQSVEFTDVYYHLDYKSLLLKTYYELREFEAMASLMEAFYVYLRRNKLVSDYNKESYANFLTVVKKLIRIRFKGKEKAIQLENQLEELKPIANLSWIRKKLSEIR
jgi:hypothetical protein